MALRTRTHTHTHTCIYMCVHTPRHTHTHTPLQNLFPENAHLLSSLHARVCDVTKLGSGNLYTHFTPAPPARCLTCSGFSPGGSQVYSSSAHPESSSLWPGTAGLCWPFPPLPCPAGLPGFFWLSPEAWAAPALAPPPGPLSMELLSGDACSAGTEADGHGMAVDEGTDVVDDDGGWSSRLSLH